MMFSVICSILVNKINKIIKNNAQQNFFNIINNKKRKMSIGCYKCQKMQVEEIKLAFCRVLYYNVKQS